LERLLAGGVDIGNRSIWANQNMQMLCAGARIHVDRQRNFETFGPDATPERLLAGDVNMPREVMHLHDTMNDGSQLEIRPLCNYLAFYFVLHTCYSSACCTHLLPSPRNGPLWCRAAAA